MPNQVPLFARQAIYNKNMEVIAYELLFRHSDANYATIIDGDRASSEVLLNAFGDHKLDDLIGNKKAFVNFTRRLLLTPPMISPKKLVVEILEDISADQEVLTAMKKLREDGFDIALDDFFITKDTKKMLAFANIIKVDVLSLSASQVEKYVTRLKPLKFTLLAEKIEDRPMMQRCIDLGFDLFQGYFLCRPEVIKGLKVSESKQATIRLLATLNSPDTPFEGIVNSIASDPALSYKILRLVNSSAFAVPVEIKSLSQAVSMLGINAIRNWASYLLLANNNGKPKELSVITMCRAKFCELLGQSLGGKALGESCFTVGLLSSLDAFLDMTMDTLLQQFNLSQEIRSALEKSEGQAGAVFSAAINYERGNWDAIPWEKLTSFGLNPNDVNRLYADAVTWATEVGLGF